MTTTYDQLTVTYDESTLTYQGLPAQFDGVAFAVEMAFGYNPLDDDPSWESVTPYVRGFSTDRGRTSEFVDYSPGTASILLDNRDRRFDPEYTSGPYFGQLNPMVPVRIQATYSGVTYTLYTGFVQGWPTAYNQSNTDAVASISCVDANRLLGNIELPSSAFAQATVDDGAALYFPMQEFREIDGYQVTYDNRRAVFATCGRFPLFATYNAEYPEGDNTAVKTGGGLSYAVAGPLTSVSIPNVYAGEYWFDARINSGTTYQLTLDIQRTASPSFWLSVNLAYSGSAWSTGTVRFNSAAAGLYGSSSTTTAFTPLVGMNHLAFTLDGTNFLVYLNGVVIRTLSLSSTPASTGSVDAIAVVPTLGLSTNTIGVSNFAFYSSSLSAAKVLEHYNAGIAFGSELSSVRLGRALDDAGWPSAFRSVETGDQLVGGYRPGSSATIRYLQQIGRAEQGALFVNAEGEVEFQSRTTAESVNVAAIFDDTGTDLPFAGVSVDAHTVDAIRNNVVVNYAYGSVTSTDAGSVAAYGQATQTVDAQLIDDPSVAQLIGDNLLARAKDPRTRITSLNVNMRRDPANLIPAVASLDLADDVVVSLTPTGVGDPLWRAVTVQGLSHTVTPQSWDVTMYLAPGPVATNGPLLILDDAVYGELDSTNKLG